MPLPTQIPNYFKPTSHENLLAWYRAQDILENDNKPFEIFSITERDETQEEYDERKRIEEEEKKKAKKVTKKEEVV